MAIKTNTLAAVLCLLLVACGTDKVIIAFPWLDAAVEATAADGEDAGEHEGGAEVAGAARRIMAIALGGGYGCALMSMGTVRCWGGEYGGTAAVIPDLTGVVSVFVSRSDTIYAATA